MRKESDLSVEELVLEQYEFFKKLQDKAGTEKELLPKYINKLIEKNGDPKQYDLSGFKIEDLLDVKNNRIVRKNTVAKHLNISLEKIRFAEHHECHAAYAYYTSPYNNKETLVLTMDSEGDDGINATVNIGKGDKIKKIATVKNCKIGRMYKFVTLLLGMKPFEHEYKVMGLAPYGNIKEIQKSYKVFDNIIKVNGMQFEWVKNPDEVKDFYFYLREKLEGHRFDGIAGALQQKSEELIVEWVTNAIEETGIKNVTFSGGISMNIKANLALMKIDGLEKFYVPPTPSDESNAIGACFLVYFEGDNISHEPTRCIKDAYLGGEFDYKKLLDIVKKDKNSKYEITENVDDATIAKILSEGNIIARCIGRMEFGARALGNRSILADASSVEVVKKINKLIKHRDFWMPFACSILEERADSYLINEKKLQADYMTIGFETKELAHNHLIAGLHPEDLTVRPQIVRKEQNPEYHNLLNEFYKITGIGGVLNTSLNLHGYPIVNTPEDLLKVLNNSDLKYVYVKDHLVRKLD
jgi:carbamoyltransferase